MYPAAYRKTALEYHPDKAGAAVADEGKKKEIEEHFQKVQDAYETLSDPAKRREYDSTDDFDDTLPSTAHPTEFFKVSSALVSKWFSIVCPLNPNATGEREEVPNKSCLRNMHIWVEPNVM